MKILNYTTSYFAVFLLLFISIWAGVFYYAMLDEIYDSIDDGLDNQKGLILQKVAVDSSILKKNNFEENDYTITAISPESAKSFNDVYSDTMMYMQNEKDYEPVRLLKSVFRHQDKYYHLQVATSMVEEDDLVAELLYAMIWLYVGLVGTILIINNLLLKKIWSPFYSLLGQLRNFNLKKAARLNVKKTNIDEFRLMNTTVQELLQNNIDAYTGQKQFIENASHELQTPLAISINKLEALAESNNLSAADITLLAAAMENLERLTRLNKSLLLLFKIENKLFHEKGSVNFNQLTKKVIADFSDQADYSRLDIDIIEETELILQMNADLASILVTNLVKNAIMHNHAGGKIFIFLKNNSFVIENTGLQAALNQQKLFSRFNHEAGSETASTGLGLAIVKAIIELYSFTIDYSFPGNHRFTLKFI